MKIICTLARAGAVKLNCTFYHSCLFESKSLQVSSESKAHFSERAKLTFAGPGPRITCSPGPQPSYLLLKSSQRHILLSLESILASCGSNSSSRPELDRWATTNRSSTRQRRRRFVGVIPLSGSSLCCLDTSSVTPHYAGRG